MSSPGYPAKLARRLNRCSGSEVPGLEHSDAELAAIISGRFAEIAAKRALPQYFNAAE